MKLRIKLILTNFLFIHFPSENDAPFCKKSKKSVSFFGVSEHALQKAMVHRFSFLEKRVFLSLGRRPFQTFINPIRSFGLRVFDGGIQ